MDATVVLWLMPVGVLAYLILFWLFLRNQDKPESADKGHTPAE